MVCGPVAVSFGFVSTPPTAPCGRSSIQDRQGVMVMSYGEDPRPESPQSMPAEGFPSSGEGSHVNPPSQPGGPTRLVRLLISEIMGTLLPAVIIAVLIHLFLAQATRVYGQSMEPTLHTDDRLLVEKITYRFRPPQRGDIVVIQLYKGSQPLIKRIVGLPGEEIAIRNGQVYINGQPLQEDYLREPTTGYLPPTRIPPMHYFVLGDNRDGSNDSRNFGPVPRDKILGRAIFRYWPPQSIGFLW